MKIFDPKITPGPWKIQDYIAAISAIPAMTQVIKVARKVDWFVQPEKGDIKSIEVLNELGNALYELDQLHGKEVDK